MTCGFLAKHPYGQNASLEPTPSYYEMEQNEREHGEAWTTYSYRADGRIETSAMCFRSAANLPDEIAALWSSPRGQDIGKSGVATEVFKRDRNCKAWYPYTLGLSPKEHLENLSREVAEQSRREYEDRVEKDRRSFDLQLFEISKSIQSDSRKIASRSFWFNLFATVIIILLTGFQVWIALRSQSIEVGSFLARLRRLIVPQMF